MPSILTAGSNGLAPSGASVGDIVNTAGGTYQVTQPGVPGASYNQASGLWSKKLADDPLTALTAYQLNQVDANSALSQAQAREQMAFQTASNAQAMAFSAREAQKNRDWQEQMSNTAHVREVRDLINAGLNPILSVNQGATTPSGASAAGVTGSGAQGVVDTNQASIINNLISSIFARDINKYSTDVQASTQRFLGQLNADVGQFSALTSANAVKAASAISAAATRYMAEHSLEGTKYSSDQSLEGTKYSADTAYASARDNPSSEVGSVLASVKGIWRFIGYLGDQIDAGSVADQHDLFRALREEAQKSYHNSQ